ncbi:MAG: ABC-F family ATP-binding cassette domain-containing protein, partial [Microthrixaceae bacterium]|nr:ABC-F family ATP-binding cassette domain-containing protein [Microthrixaceae bacterium]
MNPRSSSPSVTLTARNLSVDRAGATVLADVDLTVSGRDRLGVVGPNGVGKSTLLTALCGSITPDEGSVEVMPPNARIALLAQERERAADETVRELLARRCGVAEAESAFDLATAALTSQEPGAEERYQRAFDTWMEVGVADFPARCDEVWEQLGQPGSLLEQATSTLSGGQAGRAALAAILLTRADLVLLDEPTNDLDFDGLERLERFVASFEGPMVIVSHDRAFLERTVTHVLELDEHSHRSSLFAGGWSAFLHERELARQHAEEDHLNYERTRSDLAARAQRTREWAATGARRAGRNPRDGDKFIKAHNLAQTEKLAGKAARLDKAIERLEVVEKPWEGWDLRMELATTTRSGDVVAALSNAVLRRGDFTLGPVTLELGWAERVAIVGPNGSGKTTLLEALLGRLPPESGEARLGRGVVVGELDQARATFAGEAPLLDGFIAATGLLIADARSMLAKFGLGAGDVTRRPAELSPGERTRAALALLMARGTNCLVLDEPTNHLDLPAIDELESALTTW